MTDSGVTGPRLRHAAHLAAGEDGAGLRHRHRQPHRGPAAGAAAQGPLRRDLLRGPALAGGAPGDPRHPPAQAQARPRRGSTWTRSARMSESFSGAEIEQAVVEGLYHAFAEGKDLEQPHLVRAMGETMPLATTMKEEIARLREWAKTPHPPRLLPPRRGRRDGRRLAVRLKPWAPGASRGWSARGPRTPAPRPWPSALETRFGGRRAPRGRRVPLAAGAPPEGPVSKSAAGRRAAADPRHRSRSGLRSLRPLPRRQPRDGHPLLGLRSRPRDPRAARLQRGAAAAGMPLEKDEEDRKVQPLRERQARGTARAGGGHAPAGGAGAWSCGAARELGLPLDDLDDVRDPLRAAPAGRLALGRFLGRRRAACASSPAATPASRSLGAMGLGSSLWFVFFPGLLVPTLWVGPGRWAVWRAGAGRDRRLQEARCHSRWTWPSWSSAWPS